MAARSTVVVIQDGQVWHFGWVGSAQILGMVDDWMINLIKTFGRRFLGLKAI
jgi:hypothetical protein